MFGNYKKTPEYDYKKEKSFDDRLTESTNIINPIFFNGSITF